MNKFKQKFFEVMCGRNGMDDIGRVIFIVSLLVYFFAAFMRNSSLQVVALAGLVYTIYRVFSKDLRNRQEENQKYLQFLNFQKMRFEMRKDYRIFKCKGCGRNIRVPKGKGKLEITCPLCGRKEIHRT